MSHLTPTAREHLARARAALNPKEQAELKNRWVERMHEPDYAESLVHPPSDLVPPTDRRSA